MLRNIITLPFRQGLARALVKRNVATTQKSDAVPAAQPMEADVEQITSEKPVTSSSTREGRGSHVQPVAPPEFRFIYPEFLPDPNFAYRNKLREKLERADMLLRRSVIEIPEFYTGSVMAVTVADPNSPTKVTRFVGICIQRGGCGLRAWFILRNIVDRQGVEILYEMYCPLIQKIECLRLEKRLDESLLYLRDAAPEHSTFPFDMEPELRVDKAVVPINPLKVKLRPKPWQQRWELHGLKGVEDLGEYLSPKAVAKANAFVKPATIPAEEQENIYAEVYSQLQQQDLKRKLKRRRGLPTD
uniref:Large ribosomal subunit protein bL19m n=1 Tax=Alona affinis TaxID=381656 RepID=A0A9N6WSX8_9CRUS|nr:EOG090X0F2L [Alona affinis]